jgi:succinoglycan biosynthesis protein ExoA
MWPFISVLVPIRNEERFIASTLADLARQDYPDSRFEVIVVDGMSSDKTLHRVREVAAEFPQLALKILTNPKGLSSAARNLGVKAARGEYILIVDGHVEIPSRTLLRDMGSVIRETGAVVLGRPQRLSATGLSMTQQVIAATRASRIGHAQDSMIYSLSEGWAAPSSIAVMYRRDLFERFGGFDESFDAAEDLEFNIRLDAAGLRCYTSPKFEILYFPRASVRGLFRQMRRYGAGRTRLWRKNATLPSAAALAPALMVLGGLTLALGAVGSTLCAAVLAACACAYASLVALVRSRDSELSQFNFWWVLFTMLAIHCGLGTGILEGAFKRKSNQATLGAQEG